MVSPELQEVFLSGGLSKDFEHGNNRTHNK
jgi:hypothetical protein